MQALLDGYSLDGLLRYCGLEDLVGGEQGRLDAVAGKLRFGDLAVDCQLLGTESSRSGTFLWAWANHTAPASLVRAAALLRDFQPESGAFARPVEFTQPKVSLAAIGGSQLAAVSCALLDAAAFYRLPFPGGAAFLLVTADRGHFQESLSGPTVQVIYL